MPPMLRGTVLREVAFLAEATVCFVGCGAGPRGGSTLPVRPGQYSMWAVEMAPCLMLCTVEDATRLD
jgi:hypothetical protein